MTPQTWKALDRGLPRFLEDLTEPMGRRERRHGARVYLEGLLLDGERKSIEPMAARVAGADGQALRQFVGRAKPLGSGRGTAALGDQGDGPAERAGGLDH